MISLYLDIMKIKKPFCIFQIFVTTFLDPVKVLGYYKVKVHKLKLKTSEI
jgi:hypothetical protein